MARAPFQVAAFPFRRRSGDSEVEYAIFRRSDEGYWQSIAGGGEDDETPLQAVQREGFEEAGIPGHCAYLELQTRTTVPVIHFLNRQHWDSALLVIPVSYFAVAVPNVEIRLSWEHAEVRWVTFQGGTWTTPALSARIPNNLKCTPKNGSSFPPDEKRIRIRGYRRVERSLTAAERSPF